jgi:hypothetical protein
MLLAKEQSLPILNVLGLTLPAQAGLEFKTSQVLSRSTTTRLLQPVSSKGMLHLDASYDKQKTLLRTYSDPHPHKAENVAF